MSFANPAGFLAGLLTLPLIAWYVLRVRRPRVTVASTFLWRRSERSIAAAVPWQRFRSDATFWLVLLALVAGTLALAQPYVTVTASLGDHTIVVMDASASMLADEDGPTRLELARRSAETLVDRLGPGQVVSVVEAGPRARVLLSASGDPRAVRRALAAVRPSHGAADLTDAFTLAAALERPGQSTVVHLLSDGVVPADHRDAVPPGLLVTAVGRERPNLAVTRLHAVPVGAGAHQLFVQVRNFGTLATDADLTVGVAATDAVDAAVEPLIERRLRLGPRATEELIVTLERSGGPHLVAEIAPVGTTVTGESSDALSVDDRAYTVLPSARELTVLIAGPGNVFLETAFAAVPGVQVRTTDTVPDAVSDAVSGPGARALDDADLVVVDRVAAPAAPPRLPTVYVAPPVAPPGVEITGEAELPALTFQAPDHEILAAVDLSEVAIAAAQTVTAPALTPIASGPSGPLILAGRLDASPVVYLAFDLTQSNLPLQPAWPVLIANAVTWLGGGPTTTPASAGEAVTVPVPAGATGITVTGPGTELTVDPAQPRVRLEQAGLYRLRWAATGDDGAGGEAWVAANTVPAEGDLARSRPDPTDRTATAVDGAATAQGRHGFGRDILAVVLILALAEWAWATILKPRRARRRGARTVAA
ncbi:MAG: BatA and WFA domain-containing protein [Actinobacteria bacterium]|nr:BatA and WFA domain-containing protein [Actinomycetota bacterium]